MTEPIQIGETTADLCDRLGAQARVCHAPFRSYGGVQRWRAPIACVQTGEDAGPLRALLETPGRGRVLVVDGGGALRVALLGERMAEFGMRNGWSGVIVYGAVRDVAALATLDFAVLALGAVPQRAPPVAVDAASGGGRASLLLGGMAVSDRDWVAFDTDGVVFVRAR